MATETQTLSFYTLGPEFTNLINNLIYEGKYKSVIETLIDGGLTKDMVRNYFLGMYTFLGDSRTEEGMYLTQSDAPYSKDEFAERTITGIRTELSYEEVSLDEIFSFKMEHMIDSQSTIDNLNALFDLFTKQYLMDTLYKKILEDNGFPIVDKIDDRMFTGVILANGEIVECSSQGHSELYPYLYRLGLSNSRCWTDCDVTIHITSSQMCGTIPNEILHWDIYKQHSKFTKEQLKTVIDNKDTLEFYDMEYTTMGGLQEYILEDNNHGGKFGNLMLLKECYSNIKLPKFSLEEITGVKNCIRTSPKYSMAGLLNSKFDLNENSINEILADWEKHKNVVGNFTYMRGKGKSETVNKNELHYFYQEFIEGNNGVCHYRNDTFTYSCSNKQGDVVQGKVGNVKLTEEQENILKAISLELYIDLNKQIQLEFVISTTGEVYIVQMRTLESSREYRPYKVNKKDVIVSGKSFSMRDSDKLTKDDVLIVDEDCESEKLIGKKALIVRNEVEFSHVLALSYSLKIPSLFGVGHDFELPETFNIDTKGEIGYILKDN